MKRIFIVFILFCLFAQLGLAQNGGPSYFWTAERKIVEKDGVKYRYVEVVNNHVEGTSEGNEAFAESWARACQDSILLSRDKVTVVADRFYKRYLKAVKEAETSGVYDFPVKDYKDFDITQIKYNQLDKGFQFGLGGALVIPTGDMANLVSPIAGVSAEWGILLKKGALSANITAGIGKEKGKYLYVHGMDRKAILPYVSALATYQYPILNTGKGILSLTAGAGYGFASVNVLATPYNSEINQANTHAGGPLCSAGVLFDYKRSESFSFLRGKHSRQDRFIRMRVYTEQFCDLKEMVVTPMLVFSVGIVNVNRRLELVSK